MNNFSHHRKDTHNFQLCNRFAQAARLKDACYSFGQALRSHSGRAAQLQDLQR